MSLALAALVVCAAVAVGAVASGLLVLPVAGPTPTASGSGLALASPDGTPTPPPSPTPEPTPPGPTLPPYRQPTLDAVDMVPRLQAALDAGQAELAAPGIVATVLFPDGRSWTGVAGVADLATGRPLTADTPFAIASISKTFLAAEILQLVGEGRLYLEDAPARLLPGTLVGGRAIDPAITVRMLLDHTSGLRDFLIDSRLDKAVQADPSAVWTPSQALGYAGKPVGKPGAGYHYANTNYVLLGLIAEDLTGHTLAEEYRTRFLTPLGLADTFYQGVEKPVAELPTAYRYSSVKLDAKPADVTDGSAIRPFTAITTAAGAAGSVAASAPDLAAWARALYTGDVLPKGMVDLMVGDARVTSTLDPAYPYGLGVQVFTIDGRISYGHSGRLVGARSTVRWFPADGLTIAVVTNESRFDPTQVLVDLLRIAAPVGVRSGLPSD